mmetsp:Transcript_13034/g.23657  ORF Transcript_13034/g.23657 Transcript_13034/m.23657 type:complete len:87 (+) Transcript_13034:1188-1448(+)
MDNEGKGIGDCVGSGVSPLVGEDVFDDFEPFESDVFELFEFGNLEDLVCVGVSSLVSEDVVDVLEDLDCPLFDKSFLFLPFSEEKL